MTVPLQPLRLLLSHAVTARAMLEAAGGDLTLAFELQSWQQQHHHLSPHSHSHQHQQQQHRHHPPRPPTPSSRPLSFMDAVRRAHPLPNEPRASSCSNSASAPSLTSITHAASFEANVRPEPHRHHGLSHRRSAGNTYSGSGRSPCDSSSVQPGTSVVIVEKHNQRCGAVTLGVVARVLTGSVTHPRGIKVQLQCGAVGRVSALR